MQSRVIRHLTAKTHREFFDRGAKISSDSAQAVGLTMLAFVKPAATPFIILANQLLAEQEPVDVPHIVFLATDYIGTVVAEGCVVPRDPSAALLDADPIRSGPRCHRIGVRLMPRQDGLDEQPGSLPDIRSDVRGFTFLIRPLEINSLEWLAIRCDDSGEVWVSIQPIE